MAVSALTGTGAIDFAAPGPLESLATSISKTFDPFGVTTALMHAQLSWWMHPLELARARQALARDFIALQSHVFRRALGMPSEDVVLPNPDDARFADPVWTDSATWDIVKEIYLSTTYRLLTLANATPGLSDKERQRATFWLRKWLNMLAPNNFLATNPTALRRALETRGESLRDGWENLQRDMAERNILMVEPDAFTVGVDLATTPGKVIFRNRLVELIHYAPTTETVRSVPILIVTPWINKFYILDLTSRKSLVKYLVDQGFSVFITSWKNPGADMADVRFDDYLLEGVHACVNVVTEFCKVPKVHAVGYCIGGTLLTTYMAWANRRFGHEATPVADWTLFTTLTDFSDPGEIGVFIDEQCVEAIESSMAKKGYLDGGEMAMSFRMLRANGLIWHYWEHSYLLGEPLPRFDVLFWNMDATRMPQAMHSFYLREMYLHNKLVQRDGLHLAGESIDLEQISQPVYAVTAEDDHIAPWQHCYKLRKYLNVDTEMRFVLSSSGHILGIVNPPVDPPKRAFRANRPVANETHENWLSRSERVAGSWWTDWVNWLEERGGDRVPAYPAANRRFPALGDAPGTYVLEK